METGIPLSVIPEATNKAASELPESKNRKSETGEDFDKHLLGHQTRVDNPQNQSPSRAQQSEAAKQAERTLIDFFRNGNAQVQLAEDLNGAEGAEPNFLQNPLFEGLTQSFDMETTSEAAIGRYNDSLALNLGLEAGIPLANAQASVGQGIPSPIDSIPLPDSVSAVDARTAMTEMISKVEALVQNGGGKMTVSLNPPELGQMAIEVALRGNRVAIEMTSDNEATKGILESSLGDLKRSLTAQDLNPTKVSVSLADQGQLDMGNLHREGGETFNPFSEREGVLTAENSPGFSHQAGPSMEPDLPRSVSGLGRVDIAV